MSRIAIAPIVEGHGEQQSAIGTLLRRVWMEVVGGEYVHVLQPIRIPRQKFTRPNELGRAVQLASMKLRQALEPKKLVFVLFDADEDLPCVLGPRITAQLMRDRPDLDIALVIANVEWETWFVAAAESLTAYLTFDAANLPEHPEIARSGKGAVLRWMHNRYAETIDQPRMTAVMDLNLARRRSPSFDKLCRELEKRR